MPTMQPLPVAAILITPYAAASVVYGMYDLFRSAGRDWGMIQHGVAGAGVVQPVLVASQPGPQPILNGVVIEPEATLDAIGLPQIVCIPEATGAAGRPGRDHPLGLRRSLRHALPARAPASAQRAGRLGRGPATGDAGGGASYMDLALYLIARVAGLGCAIHTARVNLVDWHTVGQQPYAQLARSRQSEDALIAGCQAWIAEHYAEAAPVAGMVRHSRLPERTFKRRFEQATGLSPLDYVHTLRLEEAKHLLEAGDDSLDAIANSIGYEDSGFFGRLFKRNVGITPAEYRRRFGGLLRMLKAG